MKQSFKAVRFRVLLALLFGMVVSCSVLPMQNPLAQPAEEPLQDPAPEESTDENVLNGYDAEERKSSIFLDVDLILQNPELPNGCEVTSLAMVMQWLGYAVDKQALYQNYMPAETLWVRNGVTYGPNLRDTYVGDPTDASGYYVLAPGVVETANRYLAEMQSTHNAVDISGADEAELQMRLLEEQPVIVWITLDFSAAVYSAHSWVDYDGGAIIVPFANLHCAVLVGFTEEGYWLTDPLQEEPVFVRNEVFSFAYNELGAQAVVVE